MGEFHSFLHHLFRLLKLVLSLCLFRIIFLFVSYSDSFLSMVPSQAKYVESYFFDVWQGDHASFSTSSSEGNRTTTETLSSVCTVSELTSFPRPPPPPPRNFPACCHRKLVVSSVPFLAEEPVLTLPGDSPFFTVIPVNLMVC